MQETINKSLDKLRKVIDSISRLRRELIAHLMSASADKVLEEASTEIEALALTTTMFYDELMGISRRLKLLATLAQALQNQWKHIHSRRVLGRANYLDQHLSEVERKLRDIEERFEKGYHVKEIQVIRRILY